MVDIVTSCPFKKEPNCPKNGGGLDCASLLCCMQSMVYRDKRAVAEATGTDPEGTHGLKNRYEEQVNGRCGPGTDSWNNHDVQFRGLQNKLNRYIDTYKERCSNNIPDDLIEWADKQPPDADGWKGNKNATIPPECNKSTAPAAQPQPAPVPEQQDDSSVAPSGDSSPSNLDVGNGMIMVGKTLLGVGAVAGIIVALPEIAAAAAATSTAAIIVGLGSLLGGDDSSDSV